MGGRMEFLGGWMDGWMKGWSPWLDEGMEFKKAQENLTVEWICTVWFKMGWLYRIVMF